MIDVSVAEMRDNFAELLNRVAYGGERVILKRRGKMVAAVISMEDLSRLEELEDREDARAARRALAETKKKKPVSWEDVKRDLEL